MRLNLKLFFWGIFVLMMFFGFGNIKAVFAACNRSDCDYSGDPNCGWMSFDWCETKHWPTPNDTEYIAHCKMGCNPGAVTPVPGTNYRTCKVFGSWNCDNSLICYFPLPTNTPTPTPGPLVCQNLYASSLTPNLGDAITLTCEKNASYTTAVTYDFMLIKKENSAATDPNPTPTPFVKNSSNTLTTYTFPVGQYGYYLFMCRVCAGATCTNWQRPGVFTESSPTPTPPCPSGYSCAANLMCASGYNTECTNSCGLGRQCCRCVPQ